MRTHRWRNALRLSALVVAVLACERRTRPEERTHVTPPPPTPPPVEPATVTPAQVSSLAMSATALYASTRDGSLWRWELGANGDLGFRSLQRIVALADVAEVVASDRLVCVRTRAGSVWCWRDRDRFRPESAASAPAQIVGLAAVRGISVGGSTACAIAQAGAVSCWGNTAFSPVGDAFPDTPSQVANTAGALEVAVGDSHACVRVEAGVVRCWGRGAWGVLGSDPGVDRAAPIFVPELPAAERIAVGPVHSCALARMRAYCWGAGFGVRPVVLAGAENVLGLALDGRIGTGENEAGTMWEDAHGRTLVLSSDGTLRAWESSQRDFLPEGSLEPSRSVPALRSVRAIAVATGDLACAVSDDAVRCWSFAAQPARALEAPLRPFAPPPPPAPLALPTPVAPPTLATAPSTGACEGYPTAPYHLRPSPTARRDGVAIDDYASPVVVLDRAQVRRHRTVLFRVRHPGGEEGWTFLLPSRLAPGCPAAWQAP